MLYKKIDYSKNFALLYKKHILKAKKRRGKKRRGKKRRGKKRRGKKRRGKKSKAIIFILKL